MREAGLSDDVLWLGFLQGEEKNALLADADLFVLPSYSENFGVAVVEALFFGLPVIVSDQVVSTGKFPFIMRVWSFHAIRLRWPMPSSQSSPKVISDMKCLSTRGFWQKIAFPRHGVLSLLVRTYESLLSARSGNRSRSLACPSAR